MTATTTRRQSKITAAYVAIRVDFLAASTIQLRCIAREDMTIEGVNGASVHISKGEVFYLYRAASLGDNMFYIVRCVLGARKCSCPSKYRPCKHEDALSVEIAAEVAKAAKHNAVKMAPAAPVNSSKAKPDNARGTLNGNGSFLDALFGRSPEMAKYRSAYTAQHS